MHKLGNELGGIAKYASAQDDQRRAYIKLVKQKIAKALGMCDKFLECQPIFEKSLGAISDSTRAEFVVGWKRQLIEFETNYAG